MAKGTGRFGLLQGAASSAWQLGAFASNFVARGLIAGQLGFNAGFVFLSAVAACGFAMFALFMPETKVGRGLQLNELLGNLVDPTKPTETIM